MKNIELVGRADIPERRQWKQSKRAHSNNLRVWCQGTGDEGYAVFQGGARTQGLPQMHEPMGHTQKLSYSPLA